jgi:hypothetical protein
MDIGQGAQRFAAAPPAVAAGGKTRYHNCPHRIALTTIPAMLSCRILFAAALRGSA